MLRTGVFLSALRAGLASSLPGAARAQDFDLGLSAYNAADYTMLRDLCAAARLNLETSEDQTEVVRRLEWIARTDLRKFALTAAFGFRSVVALKTVLRGTERCACSPCH